MGACFERASSTSDQVRTVTPLRLAISLTWVWKTRTEVKKSRPATRVCSFPLKSRFQLYLRFRDPTDRELLAALAGAMGARSAIP